jgi:hypothetical protein
MRRTERHPPQVPQVDRAVNEHAATTAHPATLPDRSLPATATEVIAHNLNALFIQRKQAKGRKVTNQEVASYVTRVTGDTCHRTWIAKLRHAKLTAPDLARLDAVAAFFGHTRADLMPAADRDERSGCLCGRGGLAERLEAHGVDLAQLASLAPDDIRQVGILVHRLASKQEPPPDPTYNARVTQR